VRRLQQLRSGVSKVAHEATDPDRLGSALTHYELFLEEFPTRVMWRPLLGRDSPGRFEAAHYNDETITLFEASCLARGSLQRQRFDEECEAGGNNKVF
jgi:hypothetical protein